MTLVVILALHLQWALVPESLQMPRRAIREKTLYERRYPHGRVKNGRLW